MYLISLTDFIKRYGGDDAPPLDAWQVLDAQGMLVKHQDLPEGATTMFISHGWHGFAHPDAHRVKTETLFRVL